MRINFLQKKYLFFEYYNFLFFSDFHSLFAMKGDQDSKFVIISGVHKAGTTSLFRYLSQHPNIAASSIKETHFFTPLRFGDKIENISTYFDLFSPNSKTEYLIEASPSYLYGGKQIADRIIKELNANVKSILILRNPIDRLLSFYKHGIYTLTIDKQLSFDEFIEQSIELSKQPVVDSKLSRGIREGYYIDYLREWDQVFQDNLKLIFFDDLIQNPLKICQDIFKWLNIEDNIELELDIENKTLEFNNKYWHKIALKTNQYFEKQLNQNSKVKAQLRNVYQKLNTKKKKIEVSNVTIDRLESLYGTKNRELGEFLIEKKIKQHAQLPLWIKEKIN